MTSGGRPFRVQLFDRPLLSAPEGCYDLSPYQSALLILVFAERGISRPRIARHLWGVEDADSRTRQRIRQLKNQIRRRTDAGLIVAEGDLLLGGSDVTCDVDELEEAITGNRLAKAARVLADGPACESIRDVSASFDGWLDGFLRSLSTRVSTAAAARWEVSRSSESWHDARDAAEALYLLRPHLPENVARVIEGRARVGRIQSAEVAYAAYAESADPHPLVEESIERVRRISRVSEPRRVATRVPFVGRREQLKELTDVFGGVRAGRFSVALVVGEAGIGKTRLLREVERSARLEGFRCLTAEPVELERRISMNPIIDALKGIELEPHLAAIGEPWRTVIGTMLPPGPYSESVQDLPPIEEKSLSRRLLDAFSLLFRSVSDEQPTIFFLDDLQWADATTVAALQFFQRRWKESYFGIVAAVRPGVVGRKDPAQSYLSDDGRLGVRRCDLEELSDDEARRLVEELGEERVDASDVVKLCALSGRHPLYLTELTRDFLSGRLALPENEAEAFTIPISLRQILSSRMDDLDDLGRSVLHTLTVGSRPMRLGDLAEILELSLDRTADAAEVLAARQLVELDRDRLWIAHDLFRTAIYRELSEAHRAVLHHRLAEHIRSNRGEDAASELATHLDRAGRTELSAKYGWTAAGRAFERGAVAEAAHFYELVTRNERDEARRAEATAMLATSLHLNRDMSRANPALELAATRLRAAGMTEKARRMDIRRVEGLAEVGDTPVDELVDRLAAIKDECRTASDWEGVALALDTELGLAHAAGDFPGIRTTFDQMRALAKTGPVEAQAVCHSGLAMGVLFGDPDEAMRSARQAIELTETAQEHRLKALLRLMVVLQLRGRLGLPESEPLVDEARRLAQRSGDVRIRFSVESNIAVALLDAGELDFAESMLDRSTKMLGSADMDLNRFNQASNYGELALARADYASARRHFDAASTYLGTTTPPYATDFVNSGLGLCAIEAGQIPEAQRREELLNRREPHWFYDPTTIVTFRARLLELKGHRKAAYDLLVATAEDLQDRLELAWLKVNRLRLQKALKWNRTDGAAELARECLNLATRLKLDRRSYEFRELVNRLSET